MMKVTIATDQIERSTGPNNLTPTRSYAIRKEKRTPKGPIITMSPRVRNRAPSRNLWITYSLLVLGGPAAQMAGSTGRQNVDLRVGSSFSSGTLVEQMVPALKLIRSRHKGFRLVCVTLLLSRRVVGSVVRSFVVSSFPELEFS